MVTVVQVAEGKLKQESREQRSNSSEEPLEPLIYMQMHITLKASVPWACHTRTSLLSCCGVLVATGC